MGLFDKLKGNKNIELTPKGCLALAAMTLIGIDGSIEEEELAVLSRIVRGDRSAFDSAFATYKANNIEDCVELACKGLSDKQKAATAAILIDTAMSDGILAGAEERLINEYIEKFGLPAEVIENIVDVIALKNDFSAFE